MTKEDNGKELKNEQIQKSDDIENPSRRHVMQGLAAGAVATGAVSYGTGAAQAHPGDGPLGESLKNPYGGRPAGGITLPEYFRPHRASLLRDAIKRAEEDAAKYRARQGPQENVT